MCGVRFGLSLFEIHIMQSSEQASNNKINHRTSSGDLTHLVIHFLFTIADDVVVVHGRNLRKDIGE